MSFDDLERSLAGGRPVRLYLFSLGVLRWAYCNADRDLTVANIRYQALPISDDGIRQTGESSADEINITAPADLEVAQLFRGMPPAAKVELTIRDIHVGDPQAVVRQVGTVKTVKWPRTDTATVVCQPLDAVLNDTGLTLGWERDCPYYLYSTLCGVDRNRYRVEGSIQSLDGLRISVATAAGYPDGWFAGGMIEWDLGSGELDRRFIEAHTGQRLQLLGGTDGLTPNLALYVYPGCGRTIQVCSEKFGNSDNYGGANAMPGSSPFDGNPVW